jgi:AcrR family transcriptional regulator
LPRRPGLDSRVIVGQAAELADERGLDSVTLANLAERLNVRAPSLYNHIDSVDELHHQLSLFALQALANAVSQAAIGRTGPEGILAIASAYRAYAKRHPGMYRATLRAARPDDAEMQRVSLELLGVIRAVLVPFELDDTTAIHTIRGFRSIVHGFVSLEAAHGFGLPQSIDDSFRFIISSFISGLSGREATRP